MFLFTCHAGNENNADVTDGINRSQAIVEFGLDGTIKGANRNFLDTTGFTLDEIVGKHHNILMPESDRDTAEYRAFWRSLRRGKMQTRVVRRVKRDGPDIWLRASYIPVKNRAGALIGVIKHATDVTEWVLRDEFSAGQGDAVGTSMAMVEFELDGTILDANQAFLDTMGYSLSEIRGQHHSMFVGPAAADSPAYIQSWRALAEGTYDQGEFKRIGKGGREIWIQGTYNPIHDLDGKPFKIVAFASDVTDEVLTRKRAERVQQLMEIVASGAEELNATVREIAASMVKSTGTTTGAFDRVVSANGPTVELDEATGSMGGIVEAINDITGQIGLLALNATIESARVGETGRGVAAGAGKVKNLAAQAKSATDRITENIDRMQVVPAEVVEALATIRTAMDNVLDYAMSAAAVEEQSVVANDMTATVQRAPQEGSRIGLS